MKKPLAAFRYLNRQTVATIIGRKHIMRVETTRTLQWWLVLPAIGDHDNQCILLRKVSITGGLFHALAIAEYEPKIIAEEIARAAANAA